MKSPLLIGFCCVALLAAGCTDQETKPSISREDKAAEARAEAARKEMEALPKAFQTPDYFKKNDPEKKAVEVPVQKR